MSRYVDPDLRDVADLLGMSRKEAAIFCSEVAWHVTDRQITYAMIAAAIDAHPRIDPTPEIAARWLMATPVRREPQTVDGVDEANDEANYVEIEYDAKKGKLNNIQRRDFRDAQAGFPKCPHGIPITQRCRICRPQD